MFKSIKSLLTGNKETDSRIIRKLLSGNVDADREILFRVEDDKDLLTICSVNKYAFNDVCNDKFFQNRTIKKYPNTVNLKPKEMSWKNYYLHLIYYIDKIKRQGFDYQGERDPEEIYNILLIKNPEVGLERAAQKNYPSLVNHFIQAEMVEEYNDWDTILLEGTKNENKEIIDIAIKKGANDFGYGLAIAAKLNNKELIDFFIEKGGDLNQGLGGAAEAHNIDLINYFLSKKSNEWSWNEILLGASRGGHYDLVIEAIENEKNGNLFLNDAMEMSAGSGNLKLLKYFVETLGINGSVFISNAVSNVIFNNYKNPEEIIDYLESKGFNNWEYAILLAKRNKRKELVDLFMKKMD